MNGKHESTMSIKKASVYAAIFSVASYAVAAAIALSSGLYAINIFADPILNLTVPLLIISVGIQIINRTYGPLLIGLISAALYTISFLPFIAIPLVLIAIIIEAITRLIGYRSLRSVIIYTTIAGGLEGVLSTLLALYMIKVPAPVVTALYIWVGVSIGMFAESALMGFIAYQISSYLIKSGIVK